MKRENFSSGAEWEDIVGYSRAVRVGNIIEVAGTTAVENGKVIGQNDAYLQTKIVIQKIEKVLIQAGATLNDVVKTRMYVKDIRRWEEHGKAHSEFFKNIKPASTMIQVKSLIDSEMLIEIEVTAIISSE